MLIYVTQILEKAMAPHSSTLAWKIAWTEEPGGLAVHGVSRSRTRLSDFIFHFSLSCIGEGNGNPLQCSCLENPRNGAACWAVVYGVAQSQTRLKRLSRSYIVVHTWNVPNLSILLLLDVGAVYSSLLLRISFTCICFMSWMGVNEA